MIRPEREIRATYTDQTIRVYQAYSHEIAESALKSGTFVSPPFSMSRMTWIKPSFLWMMYRAGWGFKDDGQKRILAIDITHEGFSWALAHSCPSHPPADMSQADWYRLKDRSPVRVQWDPERDLHHTPLPFRAIQIGLSGEAVQKYTSKWITAISDVTPLAHAIRTHVVRGELEAAAALLPVERRYIFDEAADWDMSRGIVAQYGLPPGASHLPTIRTLLDEEIENLRDGGPHEYLRALCVLLWANGDPQDAPRIAEAKFLDFDAGCMVDSEFLVCGSLEATRQSLATSERNSAAAALQWVSRFEEPTQKESAQKMASELRYYSR